MGALSISATASPAPLPDPSPLSRKSGALAHDLAPVAAWLFVCAAMVFLMVVVGGITRLTLSGLSMTEWKPVTGIVPPLSAADWTAEFAKYKAIPEYRAVHLDMTLSEFRSIYYWEY
ncbi:MAG: COX15/CtaA family protein, partial [Alphaproteobacteria bacterium]|nr:COX15/CtaA family protein [Alphaproteobacteria bacterium]